MGEITTAQELLEEDLKKWRRRRESAYERIATHHKEMNRIKTDIKDTEAFILELDLLIKTLEEAENRV